MESHASNRALQDICARLIRDPHRLVQTSWVRAADPINARVHSHEDLLQLDLMIGHAGAWLVPGGDIQLSGVSAAVFYPGNPHGYAMTPCQSDAQFFTFKLRVSPAWPAVDRRIFAGIKSGLTGVEPLLKAARRVTRLNTVAVAQAPLLGVALCELLCLWPQSVESVGLSANAIPATELDQRIESALAMVDARLASPPTLGEMAAAAHLSPRQFARRFRSLCGVSPRKYVAARRLARARELLAQGHLNVTEVAETLGFSSIHAFSRWFVRSTGANPSDVLNKPSLL